jgi:hypothetical protein
VVGTDNTVMSEGFDRMDWNLPGAQEALVEAVFAANPKTIVVLAAGAPLGVDWAQAHVPAILSVWHNGEAQGLALADVLFGRTNPAGRLSTTWYSSSTGLPPTSDYDVRNGRTYLYFQGLPLYPFGHGLSYTTFTYDTLNVSPATIGESGTTTISVNVKNAGAVAGDEVVQLYVHDDASTVVRPIQALRGFKRVRLAPGATTTVSFPVNAQDLALWDPTIHGWVVSDGSYQVAVGASSADIRVRGSFVVGAAPDAGADSGPVDGGGEADSTTGADSSTAADGSGLDAGSGTLDGTGGADGSGSIAEPGSSSSRGCSCVAIGESGGSSVGVGLIVAVGALLAGARSRTRRRRPSSADHGAT